MKWIFYFQCVDSDRQRFWFNESAFDEAEKMWKLKAKKNCLFQKKAGVVFQL